MNSQKYAVNLYQHNIISYEKIKKAFIDGQKVVGIVHATGTGKSYNALQLAFDNKDKKIVYVVPSVSIIEHIKNIINDNSNLDMERDFANLEFRTYQSFVNMSRDDFEKLQIDLLILDEFHHIGAPVWGSRINMLIETHPEMKIFGMTAYTVRDRGTPYERDMANPEKNELFSNNIVSRYDLSDAMIDGVLPKPIYKTAHVNLLGLEKELEERILSMNISGKEYTEYMSILSAVKKRINESPSIPKILKKSIKPNGKYIYFCPPNSLDGTNDIETIKEQAFEWFKQFVLEDDIIFYTSTSEMGDLGRLNRRAFYDDVSLDGEKVDNKLRVMFAINQYNEGIHSPNIDGVILGRGTSSDIVYFEQLGRALAVRGDTKEKYEHFEKYTYEELLNLCRAKDILVKENISKEEIIEKLIAPVVIDLTNNYSFIKELENNLRDRVREKNTYGVGECREIKIRDISFDIEIEDQDLFEMLKYVKNRLTIPWEEMYEYAKNYYLYHGNLEVSQNFKTNNGYEYDECGKINLGTWVKNQRSNCNVDSDRGQKLLQIGMRFENKKNTIPWQEMYEYAKNYYLHHGDLEVSQNFKTNNGYEYDECGKINLGTWVSTQRRYCNVDSDRGQKLLQIGMRFDNKINKIPWQEMYEYAKNYYLHHGDLEVSQNFKTNNGYEYDENGKINLGKWIIGQRRYCNVDSDRGQKLLQIGMRFDNKINTIPWQEMYEYAKNYYLHHGDLEVSQNFKTNNGYEYDEYGKIKLGRWVSTQRQNCNVDSDRGQKLLQIGMRFENKKNTIPWQEMYEYANNYYLHHGDLEVSINFKTNNGYEYDENGKIKLGKWVSTQRSYCNIDSDRGQKLLQIGMRFENIRNRNIIPWEEMYEYAKNYYLYHGNLEVSKGFKTNNGCKYDENGLVNLGIWVSTQRKYCNLDSDRGQKLLQIGMRFDNKINKIPWQEMYEYANNYYLHHENLEVPYKFKTNNGYEYDECGKINLGIWIRNQRSYCNIDSDRGRKLLQIGMRFNSKKTMIDKKLKVCEIYGIDVDINQTVINHISIQELIAKIRYLKENEISIISSSGKLHEIFSISSIDMREKYGLDLEELINIYYISLEKSKKRSK